MHIHPCIHISLKTNIQFRCFFVKAGRRRKVCIFRYFSNESLAAKSCIFHGVCAAIQPEYGFYPCRGVVFAAIRDLRVPSRGKRRAMHFYAVSGPRRLRRFRRSKKNRPMSVQTPVCLCCRMRSSRPTWSLTPHSPAGTFAPKDSASPLLALSTKELCWQDLHLSRTMLTGTLPGLRGSFRLRLASTFNHGRAKTALLL